MSVQDDSLNPTFFFFFNDTATTEIYTLSLHDALPISAPGRGVQASRRLASEARSALPGEARSSPRHGRPLAPRSEEHTSELQSQSNLVCRLLLEKKKESSADQAVLTRPRLHDETGPVR